MCVFCADIQLVAQDLTHVKIDSINSSYDEQNPVVSPNGKKLYFTRSAHPENVGGVVDRGDIWVSTKNEDGSWSSPKHAGDVINHVGLNGVVGFSSSGNTMYLLNYYDKDPSTGRGILRGGLAKSNWNGTSWSDPERLSIRFFSNRSEEISAYITPDETTMILSLRSYQSYGNEDLYVTFSQAGGEWSQPKNLGNVINTPSQEWYPYLADDKKTLYFASNGHAGQGSRDIFVSKRTDGSWSNWSKPVNLGASLNTKGVEMGYFIPNEGDMAYFSTTQNSEGFGDIFNTPLNKEEQAIQAIDLVSTVTETDPKIADAGPPVVAMTMQILDIKTELPVKDAVAIFTYGTDESVVNLANVTNQEKKFVVSFVENTNVTVRIEAEGYLVYQEQFQAKATPLSIDNEFDSVEGFRLTPAKIGTTVQIENILFQRAKSDFSNMSAAYTELDKLVRLMQANPNMEIRLEGHTDNRGDRRLNQKLSEDRVKSVKAYLVDKGIDAARIEAIGFGGSKPIADNSIASSRILNRRVEFVVTKN